MSAIFNFQSMLVVLILLVCTCTYFRSMFPKIIDNYKTGLSGVFWKCARIGERLSPYVSICCISMALYLVFWTS
ncbi:protein kish-A-like [Halichondria panicea]|uniref:protein kish-A-like n=1 Tax=Halichondria panicea TaxID=6063 RepID=UPI00312B4025